MKKIQVLLICFLLPLTLVAQDNTSERLLCRTQLSDVNGSLFDLNDVSITPIVFSANGDRIAQIRAIDAVNKTIVTVWDRQSCDEAWEWDHGSLTVTVAFSYSNDSLLAVGSKDSTYVWNIVTDTEVAKLDIESHFLFFYQNLISAVADYDEINDLESVTVETYDPDSWQKINEFVTPTYTDLTFQDLDLSPDGELVAVAWRGLLNDDGSVPEKGEVSIWNINTGQKICSNNDVGAVFLVDFSVDGNYVVIGGTDKFDFHDDEVIRVLDTQNCNEEYNKELLYESDWFEDVKFVEDDNIVVYTSLANPSRSDPYQLMLLDWKNDEVFGQMIMSYGGEPLNSQYHLGVSPDGKYFAAGIDESMTTDNDDVMSSLIVWDARKNSSVNIENVLIDHDLKIFPNPTTDYIILPDLPYESTIILTDILGRKVLEKKSKNLLDLKHLASGIYMYVLLSDNRQIASGKIVKQ